MRIARKIFPTAAVVMSAACLMGAAQGQAFASGNGGGSTAPTTSNRASWHESAPDKLMSMDVREGTLTVDGMVVKVQLNYDIKNAGYMYFFVPGTGTAIVSLVNMSGSVLEKDAFRGNTLKFSVGGHDFDLTSETSLVGGEKGRGKMDAYVRLDHTTPSLDRYPEMGYGMTTKAPYVWPTAKCQPKSVTAETHFVQPPPLPRDMLPRTEGSYTTTVAATEPANK